MKILAAALAAAALLAAAAGAATPALPQIKVPVAPKCAKKPTTTLQLTACARQRVSRSTEEINKHARAIWGLLKTAAPRTRFATAERAWLAYRGANCKSRSDAVTAGSRRTLESVTCAADMNRQHSRELKRFEADLRKR